jgi:hypothetical protein
MIRRTITFLYVLVVVCSFGIQKSIATTQVNGDIKISPKNPEPHSQVTLSFNSYSFNPDFAHFVWKVNSTTVLEGEGEKVLTTTTGAVGEQSIITVEVSSNTGYSLTQQLTLSPSFIALIYEAPESYVPHFYPGRSLPSDGAEVKVTALPFMGSDQTLSDPSQLSYTWYLNDAIIRNTEGKGKQSVTVALDFLRTKNEVKVVVKNKDGATATKSITIIHHKVMPKLYEYDELFGTLFDKNIGKRFETTKDFITILEPFYVSKSIKTSDKTPTFKWLLNGMESTPLGGRVLAFSPAQNSYGIKNLSITVYGPDKRLQQGTFQSEFVFDTRK